MLAILEGIEWILFLGGLAVTFYSCRRGQSHFFWVGLIGILAGVFLSAIRHAIVKAGKTEQKAKERSAKNKTDENGQKVSVPPSVLSKHWRYFFWGAFIGFTLLNIVLQGIIQPEGKTLLYLLNKMSWLNWIWFFGSLAVFGRIEFLEEGFALAITRAGAFRKFVMRWQGKKFQGKEFPGADQLTPEQLEVEQWAIIDAVSEEKWFGGLVLMWFFDKPHQYNLSWMTVKQSEGGDKISVHNRELLLRVLLKDKTYYVEIKEAEDSKLMPLRITALITLRVQNPYKTIFLVDDWLQVIISKIAPAVRDAMTDGAYQDLIVSKKDIGAVIIEHETDLVSSLLKNYGVLVLAVEIKDIDPEKEEDRKATEEPMRAEFAKKAAEIKAQQEAEVLRISTEAKANARKVLAEAETAALAMEWGQFHTKVAEFLVAQGRDAETAHKTAENYVERMKAAEQGALTDIRVGGAEGLQKALMEIISSLYVVKAQNAGKTKSSPAKVSDEPLAQGNQQTAEQSGKDTGGITIPPAKK